MTMEIRQVQNTHEEYHDVAATSLLEVWIDETERHLGRSVTPPGRVAAVPGSVLPGICFSFFVARDSLRSSSAIPPLAARHPHPASDFLGFPESGSFWQLTEPPTLLWIRVNGTCHLAHRAAG